VAQPKHILVLTYWGIGDALIQTYTLPYLRIMLKILPEGSTVHFMTLERDGGSAEETLLEDGIYHFSFPLYGFGWKAAFSWLSNLRKLKKIIRQKNISTIHTWCTSAGSIGWLLSKRTGIPLVLDSFEPHAEAMVETGTWKRGGIAHRVLFFLERKQAHHAQWRIGVVRAMQEYAAEKYDYHGSNFLFKPACVDLEKFTPAKRKNPALVKSLELEDKITCAYVGKFGGLYLRAEAFEFFKQCFDYWGDRFRVLLITSTKREEIDALCKDAGILPANVISVFLPPKDVPDYLGLGDFAISAVKPVPSRKCCTPIKNGEYWAMGLPVMIAAGISEDSEIISSSKTGIVRENLSSSELERSVKQMDELLKTNTDGSLSIKIRELAVKHRNYKIAEEVYRKIYG
jgi:glycosyltransferase involved in cell wall biosynthesis